MPVIQVIHSYAGAMVSANVTTTKPWKTFKNANATFDIYA